MAGPFAQPISADLDTPNKCAAATADKDPQQQRCPAVTRPAKPSTTLHLSDPERQSTADHNTATAPAFAKPVAPLKFKHLTMPQPLTAAAAECTTQRAMHLRGGGQITDTTPATPPRTLFNRTKIMQLLSPKTERSSTPKKAAAAAAALAHEPLSAERADEFHREECGMLTTEVHALLHIQRSARRNRPPPPAATPSDTTAGDPTTPSVAAACDVDIPGDDQCRRRCGKFYSLCA